MPGYGNLPGKGGSGKRRTGSAQNSNKNKKEKKNKNNENLSTALNVASTIKSAMVEGTVLAMEIAKDTKVSLPLLRTTANIVSIFPLVFTIYQVVHTDQYAGRPGEAVADLAMGFVAFVPGWGWAASSAYFLVVKPIIKSGE